MCLILQADISTHCNRRHIQQIPMSKHFEDGDQATNNPPMKTTIVIIMTVSSRSHDIAAGKITYGKTKGFTVFEHAHLALNHEMVGFSDLDLISENHYIGWVGR